MPVPLVTHLPTASQVVTTPRGAKSALAENTALNCTKTELRCGVHLSWQLPLPVNLVPIIVGLEPREKCGGEEGVFLSESSLPWNKSGPDLNIPHLPAFVNIFPPSAFAQAHINTHSVTDDEALSCKRSPYFYFFLYYYFSLDLSIPLWKNTVLGKPPKHILYLLQYERSG